MVMADPSDLGHGKKGLPHLVLIQDYLILVSFQINKYLIRFLVLILFQKNRPDEGMSDPCPDPDPGFPAHRPHLDPCSCLH